MEENSVNTQDIATDSNKLDTESEINGQSEKKIEENGPEENEPGEENATKGEQADDQNNLEDDVEALAQELNKIIVHPPTVEPVPQETFDPTEFPASYKDNLPKEKLILQYCDNFCRQYVHLYRDRKPLFVNPINECGVEKFICTTLRPTQLPFKELYNWEGAADFVADYLSFEPLEPPYELPPRLISPATVINRQKGNCFEYNTLLVSLLIAAGYDAYVVSGYASRETCLADESRGVCPLLKKKEEAKQEEKKMIIKKYSVKPPRDLTSKFILKQERRKVAEQEAEEEKRRVDEELKQLEREKPAPDPLLGLRVHSWVLVLAGKREVPESFFIEPFTGLSHELNSESYHGIESLWNNFNYWVNMQDCSEGVKDLSYDLGDCTVWEYMFPGVDKQLLIPESEDDLLDMEDEEEKVVNVEKHLDMPPSWVEPLRLSQRDYEMRCPKGIKTKLYKRSKLEKFAPYLRKDGLVSKLSVYDNRELTDLILTKEYYSHRQDKLHTRVHNQRTGWITEYFNPGRARCLKEHQYRAGNPGPENDRTMVFYNEARVDGLMKRVETPNEMTEDYTDRDDFLYYKHVQLGKRSKKFGPQDGNQVNLRPIEKMVLKFHRNKSQPANNDIAEMVFLVSEDKIQITYHTEDSRIASSTREFVKPPNWDEKGAILAWANEMHQTFQVDPDAGPGKQLDLYMTLVNLLKAEETAREKFRESEEEVVEILDERTNEESVSELEISVYDTDRNEKAKKHRREVEHQKEAEKMRKQEMEIDYLAPFLAQIGDPEKITRMQAYKLKEDCLADLKQRLIDKANLIQARFEKETQELQKKQAWYQQNQVSMQKDDEEEYLNYCSEAMFRIHILEMRLNRHKESAPEKYMMLDKKLRQDPRLAEFL
ncbi:dynein regulatory complex subunit 7-like [Gigantopelta aegis]|uniref:dynein regulatory complex subunit 7-like n=1 Tax=Gigantopelta aegis TaxID=1735272 RepID=UPI001B88B683|nr:dynein regulatory complex subunit 7-like [Gigantopelta aegis]